MVSNILTFFIFALWAVAWETATRIKPVEPLFLEFPVEDMWRPGEMQFDEEWSTAYVDSILEKRYGDAIWARYHIYGDVVNGIIDGGNTTVLDSIEEDAIYAKRGEPELYSEAIALFATTNSSDAHTNILELLLRIETEDVPTLKARLKDLRKRTRFSGTCVCQMNVTDYDGIHNLTHILPFVHPNDEHLEDDEDLFQDEDDEDEDDDDEDDDDDDDDDDDEDDDDDDDEDHDNNLSERKHSLVRKEDLEHQHLCSCRSDDLNSPVVRNSRVDVEHEPENEE